MVQHMAKPLFYSPMTTTSFLIFFKLIFNFNWFNEILRTVSYARYTITTIILSPPPSQHTKFTHLMKPYEI
jgi:hypothetical protein